MNVSFDYTGIQNIWIVSDWEIIKKNWRKKKA